jgi:hypothetical protein
MDYPASVEQRRGLGRCVRHGVLAALLLAGCRDVLGVTGYGLLPRADASVREAGAPPRDAHTLSPNMDDGRATSEPEYTSPYGTEYVDARCGMCMDQYCGSEAEACSHDVRCATGSSCLAQCGGPGADWCWVLCNQITRRTPPMSELMACAAHNCPDHCAIGHATYRSRGCTDCLTENAGPLLNEFAKSVAALDLDSCRQDCPPPYRDERCPCSDIYRFGSRSSVAEAGPRNHGDAATDGGRQRSTAVVGDAAWDAGNGSDVLNALEAVVKDQSITNKCYTACNEPDWSCLNSLPSSPPFDDRQELELDLTLFSVLDQPTAGAHVRICQAVDPDCVEGPEHVTDAAGFTRFSLKRNTSGSAASSFFGSLLVNWEGDSGDDPSSALLYFIPIPPRSPTWTVRRLVSTTIANGNVMSVIGRLPNWQENGGIVFSVTDCNGVAAPDVTAELDGPHAADSDLVFYSDGQWSLSRTATSTTSSALGAFVDVTTSRQRTLTLYHYTDKKNGTTEKIGSYSFNVRVGAITTLALAPYQDPRQ